MHDTSSVCHSTAYVGYLWAGECASACLCVAVQFPTAMIFQPNSTNSIFVGSNPFSSSALLCLSSCLCVCLCPLTFPSLFDLSLCWYQFYFNAKVFSSSYSQVRILWMAERVKQNRFRHIIIMLAYVINWNALFCVLPRRRPLSSSSSYSRIVNGILYGCRIEYYLMDCVS